MSDIKPYKAGYPLSTCLFCVVRIQLELKRVKRNPFVRSQERRIDCWQCGILQDKFQNFRG
jgi:hypothetical protein